MSKRQLREVLRWQWIAKQHPCPACHGTGRVGAQWCRVCGASGVGPEGLSLIKMLPAEEESHD